MTNQLLMQILETLKEIQGQLAEMQSGSISVPVKKADEEDSNDSIAAWLDEQNAGVEEIPQETGTTEPEIIFEVLPGIDPAGFEGYIGKPMSEVDMSIIQMISRPDYAARFAPKKFPQDVIDAAMKLAE